MAENSEVWIRVGTATIGALAALATRFFKRAKVADNTARLDKMERWTRNADLRIQEVLTRMEMLEERVQTGELDKEEQAREIRSMRREFREGLAELLRELKRMASGNNDPKPATDAR